MARGDAPPCPKMPRTCPSETSTCPQSPSIGLGFDPVGVGKIFLERKVRKKRKGGKMGKATGNDSTADCGLRSERRTAGGAAGEKPDGVAGNARSPEIPLKKKNVPFSLGWPRKNREKQPPANGPHARSSI